MNLFSKEKIKSILLIVLLSGVCVAQSKSELKMKIKATSVDDRKQIVLHSHGEMEDFYDGYIVFPNFMDRIQGGMAEGGFSFLDYTGMDTYFETKKQREQLAKNKYPSGDLEVFSNGFDADKVLSFRIIPEFVDERDDTVSLFIKYVLYDFDNKQVDYFKWDAKINLHNKLLRIPLNKEIIIQFFDDKLSDYKLSIFLSRIESDNDLINIKNKKLFKGIKESAKSCKPIGEKFKFELNFGKSNELSDYPYSSFFGAPNGATQSNINLIDVESFNVVGFGSERVKLSNNIYHAKIISPFSIENEEKEERYKSYSTREKIFTSEYNVYFLPTSIDKDSLVGELFISIEKLNIEDGIERWSPIQKNVKMKIYKINTNSISTNRILASLIFKLPKENWSAFFGRNDEEYEIYGYSDYEKFMNEYINIVLATDEVEK